MGIGVGVDVSVSVLVCVYVCIFVCVLVYVCAAVGIDGTRAAASIAVPAASGRPARARAGPPVLTGVGRNAARHERSHLCSRPECVFVKHDKVAPREMAAYPRGLQHLVAGEGAATPQQLWQGSDRE